jgi:hypothetical protein
MGETDIWGRQLGYICEFFDDTLSFGVANRHQRSKYESISLPQALWPTYGRKKENAMINKYEENESGPQIKKGGLYSAFPIPAYQVLGKAREYQAQKVLLCLVSHLGKGSNCVYPSYTTIARSCGMSRNSISAGLTVLFEYGFIKIFRFRDGKKDRSKYYIQNACWDSSLMNEMARKERVPIAVCIDCGVLMDRGGFGISPLGKIHYGCGGSVIFLETKNRA